MRIGAFSAPEVPVLLMLMLASVLPLFLFWRIFNKAGFSGALALLLLLPGVGLLAASLILAIAEWPVQRARS